MPLSFTALALFESSDNVALANNPANQTWLTIMAAVSGSAMEVLARRYDLALQHFRRPPRRPALQGRTAVVATGRKAAQVELLKVWSQPGDGPFVQSPQHADPTDVPPALRAFLAAPLLGVGDDCTSVHRLLHSNPSFG